MHYLRTVLNSGIIYVVLSEVSRTSKKVTLWQEPACTLPTHTLSRIVQLPLDWWA